MLVQALLRARSSNASKCRDQYVRSRSFGTSRVQICKPTTGTKSTLMVAQSLDVKIFKYETMVSPSSLMHILKRFHPFSTRTSLTARCTSNAIGAMNAEASSPALPYAGVSIRAAGPDLEKLKPAQTCAKCRKRCNLIWRRAEKGGRQGVVDGVNATSISWPSGSLTNY